VSPGLTLIAWITLAMCGGAVGVVALLTRTTRRAMWIRAAGLDDNGDLCTLEGTKDGAELVRRRDGDVMARSPGGDESHPVLRDEERHRARWTADRRLTTDALGDHAVPVRVHLPGQPAWLFVNGHHVTVVTREELAAVGFLLVTGQQVWAAKI
jgi:hypothetical protein